MTYILSLIKNRKLLIGVGVVVFLSIISWVGWSELKNGIYDRGYNDAVQEYQKVIEEQRVKHQEYVIGRLQEVRKQAQVDKDKAIARLRVEQSVDTEVKTVTEYIEKEIYVQDDCDVVPVDLNSMFNDSIRSINGDK